MEDVLSIPGKTAEQNRQISEVVQRELGRLRNFIRKQVYDARDAEDAVVPDPDGQLRYVMDTVTQVRRALAGDVPLIGFAGSPGTDGVRDSTRRNECGRSRGLPVSERGPRSYRTCARPAGLGAVFQRCALAYRTRSRAAGLGAVFRGRALVRPTLRADCTAGGACPPRVWMR